LDYESEQLNAYDAADAQRYLLASIKKPEPNRDDLLANKEALPPGTTPADMGQQFLIDQNLAVPEEDRAKTGEAIKRTIGGGIVDAANVGMEGGSDLLEAGFFGPANALAYQQLKVKVPPSRLADIPEPEGIIGQLVRDFVQFGTGMILTPGVGAATRLGKMLEIAGRSALAEGGYFDPKEGGFIRPLIDLGILPQAVEFLAVESSEEDTVLERLKSRAGLGLQGGTLGLVFDGLIETLRAIKNNPTALRYATNTILTAVGATPLISSDAEGSPSQTLKRIVKLTKAERDVIKTDVANQEPKKGAAPVILKDVVTEAERIKNEYPTEDGWLPINVQTGENIKDPSKRTPTFKVNKDGVLEINWQQPAYAFHIPPGEKLKGPAGKAQLATHKQNLVDTMTSDVAAVVERAKNGDQDAIKIINQANWYRSMRTRLRQEFGGLGDVFADIIGATSAQTNVQQNFENALQVLRRYTRGEFDEEIAIYTARVESGDSLSSKELNALHNDENSPFKLITKASGVLFNTNSPAATEALLDMFRQIKPGKAPKTINFTGNLIGFGNEATIDVWAARYLRDAAGLPRIPPPAEKAVSGKHLTKSTFDDPQIGAEFGFGQEVFNEAASELNASGIIREVNPELGDIGPDDLQAVVWFLEKEKWTKNGWTTKAGEGGSLDYESVYGGSPDRNRVAQLRSIINKKGSTPQQIADAQAELATLEGAPQRFTAGVSMERPNQRPTNPQQAQLASELTAPVKDDPTVIGYQANNTYGEFMGDAERALNFEVVTQTNFDPTNMTKALVEAGRKYDQDAVFVSKVVPAGTANARPGVEVYFRDRQGADYAQQITAILRERGIDGFTFVTDARQMDRVDVQAAGTEDVAGLVGIRFQYIPEFDDAFDASNAEQIFADKAKLFRKVMNDVGEIDGITYADVVYYDTTVFKNTDRSGTEWINGGTSYEEYLRGAASGGAEGLEGQGNIFSEAAP
jgi:hypothetical protein